MAEVHLNVGGCVFTTSLTTLTRRDSFFSGLVSHRQCNENVFFIDRDPMHFRYVLNWLRGVHVLPEDNQSLLELTWEADFYALDDMVRAIRKQERRDVVSTIKALTHVIDRHGSM